MKRFLSSITDSLAEAALLEMGASAEPAGHEPLTATVKRLFRNVSITMADAALVEVGVSPAAFLQKRGAGSETLEENLIEAAFAEAADFDGIHGDIVRNHGDARDVAHPDDCQYGDNDLCFV